MIFVIFNVRNKDVVVVVVVVLVILYFIFMLCFHNIPPNRIRVHDMLLYEYNCVGSGRPDVQAVFDSGIKTCESKTKQTKKKNKNRTMPGNMFSKPSAYYSKNFPEG